MLWLLKQTNRAMVFFTNFVTGIMIIIIIIFMIDKESFKPTEKQSVQLEMEENELLIQIERERIEKEKNELMKKQNQTLETEKNGSLSHLEQHKKQSEQLETEKKQLLFQLEEEMKELQHVSGNLHYLNYSFIHVLLLIIS